MQTKLIHNNDFDFELCAWDTADFLFFSDNIWGDYIYYSHLFPSLSGLLIASFIFLHARNNLAAKTLLFTVSVFTIWSLIDLVIWASGSPEVIMTAWSSLIYFELLIYVGSLYFVYAYITKKHPPLWAELLIFTSFIPLFLFGHTKLNLVGFDFTNCWREAFEGPLWQYYIYYVEIFITCWIIIFGVINFTKQTHILQKRETILVTIGTVLFLASFSIGNILGSFETDWVIAQVGLFGMPIFVLFLSYLMVRYRAFQINVLAAEALFAGSFLLILSLLFIRKIENAQIVAAGTLVLFSILGYLLIRSIKKEVFQKERIEDLAQNLERANLRLQELDKMKSEFVSIASHQLRSPLTAIRGYASLMREGTYGTLPELAVEPLERIEDSAKSMALTIEDYLNVSRIEAGNMKYNFTDFNLRDEVEKIVDDLRPIAIKQSLVLLFRSDLTSRGIVHADIGKVQQIIHNLVNNAIKYTEHGSIVVTVSEQVKERRILVAIRDTGIGMSEATKIALFQKFSRATDAHKINSTGTGLGLYVALKMTEAMGGTITADSEGEGKGSAFTLILPLAL